MHEPTQDAMWVYGIDLAQEADFALGSLRVRPATCEVEWNGTSQTLQRRVMQVLVALAHARGSVVSQDDLVIRCWRGLSVSDDAIYRCISKLRKLAAGYPDTPFTIEAIPGVGYRLTSPERDEASVAEFEAPRKDSLRSRSLIAAAVILILALAGAAFWMFNGRSPGGQPLRVAVQPFEALGNSEDARSLARRIPNEVVDSLGDSQIEAVLDGGQSASPASRAPGLIVTGILRDDGKNAIVDVRIESGTSRAALWSAEFGRDRREASDLPLEVAARVTDIVNMINFARSADPPLTDDSALTPLLQLIEMLRETPDGAWALMLEKAQAIVARHPDFAFGHSVLAAAYAEAAESIDVPNRSREMSEAARREANLTLKLDPEDAGAYAVLSMIERDDNYRAREAILQRGIQNAKHPKEPLGALYSYEGTLLANVGRLREALSYQLIAHANDEWGPPKTVKLARDYANSGNLPAARGWLRKAVQRWPKNSNVRRMQLYIAGFYERPADGLVMIKGVDANTSSDDDRTAIWRTFIEAKAEHHRPAEATIQKIRESANQGKISRETEIMMLAQLGETRKAIETANLALDRQEQLQPIFLFTPITRNIRQDPGFIGLANRMGLIRYWRETGTRPDFCADAAKRSECSPQLLAALKSS